jgi:energy-coupling factor transporter ATP-binding protein EcfA2
MKYKSLLSIIEDNDYIITNDKLVLLFYRIKTNIPVILMGEPGCGKTALIFKLNQILNNGEINVEIINVYPRTTEEKLCEFMKRLDTKANEKNDKELWIFFDEMNTCLSLSFLTEIFINKTYNGNKFSDNIRLIGAYNPYRRRKRNKEKFGINISEDNDKELVYLVQPLPQSLLYYVFIFGRIDDNNEKKYII